MIKPQKLLLPALRGFIGDWVYYSCLMPIPELAARVEYAQDIHYDDALSKMIQRSLEGPRAEHIATYLDKTKERFFNSLVLATYDGSPEWLEINTFRATNDKSLNELLSEDINDSIGFLSLSGHEHIFAVDGQHRLAGIKKAISNKSKFGDERLPVIFIAHSEEKRERTRRLFTTLNKTAKPVKKADIIALDEDDTMAIISRRLIETNKWFSSPKILVNSSENIPSTNRVCLTTISNLYDVLKLIFKHKIGEANDLRLRFYRPSDNELDSYYKYAERYFESISNVFPEVKELFHSTEPALVTQKYRGEHGGHLLYRPVGLLIFTNVVISYSRYHDISLNEAVDKLSCLPTQINSNPYRGVIWDPDRKKMILTGKKTMTDLLTYLVGLPVSIEKLSASYAKALGETGTINLPTKIFN